MNRPIFKCVLCCKYFTNISYTRMSDHCNTVRNFSRVENYIKFNPALVYSENRFYYKYFVTFTDFAGNLICSCLVSFQR